MQYSENIPLIKPRLLIILNRFVIGGQAVDTIPLAWNLISDFDILILHGEKEKDEIEPTFLLKQYPGLQLKKVRQLRRSINPFVDAFAFFTVLSMIISFKANVVHTHGAKSGFIGRLAAWLAGVPVIIHTFHGHFFHSYFSKRLSSFIAGAERMIGKITTCAVALSDVQKNELANTYRILPASKIEIIPLGFAFDQINATSVLQNSFRNKYGLKPFDVAIGIVGRIVAVKNHSFFVNVIDQFSSVPANNPVAFFIIGDGNLKNIIQKELNKKRIRFSNKTITSESRVLFTSWLTNMYEVMNGLDIVVLTSLNEGTPLSIIEAEFFKKPVVSTNVGGVKDTMLDGRTGFLVDSNDVTTFVQKLRLLVENKELRDKMGEEGHKFVSEKFSRRQEIVATKKLYITLLKQKGYPL